MIQVSAKLFFERFCDQEKLEERPELKEVKSMYEYNILPLIHRSVGILDKAFMNKEMTDPITKDSAQKLIYNIEHEDEAVWYAEKNGIPLQIKIIWKSKEPRWKSQEHIIITSVQDTAGTDLMFYTFCLIDLCIRYYIQELTAEKV